MNNFMQALQGKSRIWFGIAFVFIIIGGVTVFWVFQKIQATETYYTLNQDVNAMQEINPAMLSENIVSLGGSPSNALDIGDVQLGGLYATYNLAAGDIITESNTGPMQELTEGIPDEFVIASFEVEAQNSVAGYIQRGDYIDVIAVGQTNSASGEDVSSSKYVIKNAIVVSVDALGNTTDAATINDPNASNETATARSIGNVYTVALPPADAATLALVKDMELLVVLSPRTYLEDGAPDTYLGTTPGEVFGYNNVGDSGYCTDPFFGALTEEDVAEAQETGEELPIKPECSIPGDIFGYEYDEEGNIIGEAGVNNEETTDADSETDASLEGESDIEGEENIENATPEPSPEVTVTN